jgi:hypothetical protein
MLSTMFEDFLWTANTAIGFAIILIGNLFVLTPAETLSRAYRRVKPVGA